MENSPVYISIISIACRIASSVLHLHLSVSSQYCVASIHIINLSTPDCELILFQKKKKIIIFMPWYIFTNYLRFNLECVYSNLKKLYNFFCLSFRQSIRSFVCLSFLHNFVSAEYFENAFIEFIHIWYVH